MAVLTKPKSSRDLETEFDDLAIQAQAHLDVAEKEERELTDGESTEFNSIMDKETGLLAMKRKEIDTRKTFETQKAKLALEMRANRTPEDLEETTTGSPRSQRPEDEPRIYHKMARLKAFPNNNDGAKDAYFCGMWIRAVKARGRNNMRDQVAEDVLASRNWTPQAAQTEGTDTAGGFTVPEPLSSAIIDIREDSGVARRLCDVLPMSSKTEDVPKRTGGLTVFYPGEGNTVTTSDMAFGRVNLVAIKRAVANQISNELSDDSLVNMTDRAIKEMGYALSRQEDNEFINADGTSTYGGENGVLNSLGSAGLFTAPTGESTWLLLSNASISQWKGLLPGKYFDKSAMAIICTSEFYYNVFDRLMNAAGGNTNANLRTGGLFDVADLQYNGIPIFLTDQLPSTTAVSQNSALYGNFGLSCMLGDRTGTRMSMSMDYAFLDDVNTLLATSRYDFNIHEPGDSSTAGGYVGLATASS